MSPRARKGEADPPAGVSRHAPIPNLMSEHLDFRTCVTSLEEANAAFFRRLGQRASDPRLAEVFRFLADEESQHAELLGSLFGDMTCPDPMLESLSAPESPLAFLLEDNADLDRVAQSTDDEVKILRLGLSLKKNTLLFHAQMARALEGTRYQGPLGDIIEHEKRHFEAIYRLIKIARQADRGPLLSPDQIRDALQSRALADERDRS